MNQVIWLLFQCTLANGGIFIIVMLLQNMMPLCGVLYYSIYND